MRHADRKSEEFPVDTDNGDRKSCVPAHSRNSNVSLKREKLLVVWLQEEAAKYRPLRVVAV